MDKWYKGVYRRNLVDMHIADWDDVFLSKFDVGVYYEDLVRAKITSPMIYLQSHTGLCNYPTRSGKTHEYFKKHPNAIKDLIKKCKDGGMKVVGYYSLIFNNAAADAHPEWEMRYADGTTWRDRGQRYGLCCPNNVGYRAFLKEQIKELGEEFKDLDGIFYDMPYWEVVCRCDACKERFRKEVGGEMPEKIDWKDEKWRALVKKRQEWMAEFAMYAREESLKAMPQTTVELNFAAGVACDWLAGSTEGINEACEFTGGDLYGDLYNHSFTCKYYYGITRNQPFEYMTCRCNRVLREHTVSKPEINLEAEVMLTAAHHGASLIIDAINPDGTLDERVYDRIGRVFEKQIPYERFMDKGELYADAAVYFDSKTQFSPDGKPYNKQCAISAVRTLIEKHIPVSVIANGNMNGLGAYKMIIAPALETFGNPEILKFIDYVKGGGVLYLSGRSDERLVKEFFGGKIVGETFGDSKFRHVYKGYDEVQAYVAPTGEEYEKLFGEFDAKYPLPLTYKLPVASGFRGDVRAKIFLPYTDPDDNTVFASIHSNPPARETDIPAVVETAYGKGKVVWFAPTIESDGRQNFKDLFAGVVRSFVKPKFGLFASKFVEQIIFKDGDDYYVNLFDLNFAEDCIKRDFTLVADGYRAAELLSGEELEEKDGKIVGSFEKYLWLKLTKEKR